MRGVPTCRKCGTRHFNLFACEEAKEKLQGTKQPQIEYVKREGWSEWGHRPPEGYTYQGGTLWQTRKAKQRGNING